MLADGNERAGVQEQYEVAGNTSNLRVEAEKRGAGDVMIAGGYAAGVDAHVMSPTRLGMALLRLHSEWSSAAKPKRVPRRTMEILGAQIKNDDVRAQAEARRKGEKYANPGPVAPRAQAMADSWFANELRILAVGLKSRPLVWEAIGPWAATKGIPTEVVGAALLHWLDHACPICDGHGLRKVPDAPALSARQCTKCNGTGHRTAPDGAGRVLGHLDYCLGLARGSLKQRLRNK